jgi:prealbumin domain-containing protein
MGGATTSSRLTRRVASLLLTPADVDAAAVGPVLIPSSVTLEQWDPAGSGSWIHSNLNSGYVEGDVVPFRLTVTDAGNTAAGTTSTFSICRDFEDPGMNGYLFVDDYNKTKSPALGGATLGNTMSHVMAAGVGATVTIVSVTDDTTPTTGDCAAGERETEVEFTIAGLDADGDRAYILWGGHLASPFDTGVAGDGASAYSGSSLHMAIIPSKSLPIKVGPAPAGNLTVTKSVTNTFGGTLSAGDFPLFVNGAPVTSGVATHLPAGTYTVSETQQPGYERLSFVGACAPSGTVVLGDGQNLSCTITNHDVAPRLTVIKHVDNNDGGTLAADAFTMNVTGTQVSTGSFHGSEAGTTVTLDAGAFSVTETGPAGYTPSYSAGCSGTIAIGETQTCTITNDDQPASLKVITTVVNDNGGTLVAGDVTINVTGTDVSDDSFPGSGAGTTVTLDAGGYSVAAGSVPGYTVSYSADCTGTVGNCS